MNVSLYYICSNALSVNILGALEAETEDITLKGHFRLRSNQLQATNYLKSSFHDIRFYS